MKGNGFVVVTDLLGAPFSLLPVLACYGTPLALFTLTSDWRLWVLGPFFGLAAFLLSVRALRALLPGLTPGVSRLSPNRRLVSWYGHLALGRAVKVAGLWPLFLRLPPLARLYMRLMGARVGRGVRFGRGVELVDLPLLSFGDDVFLGDRAVVLAHNMFKERIVLVPVELGHRVQVGADSQVAVGARIGDGTRIGAGTLIAMLKVEPNSEIAGGSYLT